LPSQHEHQLLVIFGLKVDRPAGLGSPQLAAVVLEQRRHRRVLAAVEGPLVFADDDRVELMVWVSHCRQ
jgi:hypothetical protein